MDVDYKDVTRDDEGMRKMLELTGGKRAVPVIVENGETKIGFGGT